MRFVFGSYLFEAPEVVSMTGMHPQTLRKIMQTKPQWHRIIGGRHYWTKDGIREAFGLTDEQVEDFIKQCRTRTIKGYAA